MTASYVGLLSLQLFLQNIGVWDAHQDPSAPCDPEGSRGCCLCLVLRAAPELQPFMITSDSSDLAEEQV